MVSVSIVVNGLERQCDVEPRLLLVGFLRDVLGLTGTHIGCETSSCGACTVLVDGESVKACTVLTVQADGSEVTTIEGLAQPDGSLHEIQQAFGAEHALQCGFCTPGMIMAVASLLKSQREPTDRQIRDALEGNLCRCTGYQNIVKAVHSAACMLRGQSYGLQTAGNAAGAGGAGVASGLEAGLRMTAGFSTEGQDGT